MREPRYPLPRVVKRSEIEALPSHDSESNALSVVSSLAQIAPGFIVHSGMRHTPETPQVSMHRDAQRHGHTLEEGEKCEAPRPFSPRKGDKSSRVVLLGSGLLATSPAANRPRRRDPNTSPDHSIAPQPGCTGVLHHVASGCSHVHQGAQTFAQGAQKVASGSLREVAQGGPNNVASGSRHCCLKGAQKVASGCPAIVASGSSHGASGLIGVHFDSGGCPVMCIRLSAMYASVQVMGIRLSAMLHRVACTVAPGCRSNVAQVQHVA
ncbi:hypothetical protein HHK36_032113 [Tetracentron sinense]|uniref:Uncharacterized protein n=1 Tax=Tetracentron sinense TaxID=13715 RepID=A0A834YA11_TETSI|nr:hypothetical protein HHK36_032113 [Tetracentron sinense]